MKYNGESMAWRRYQYNGMALQWLAYRIMQL